VPPQGPDLFFHKESINSCSTKSLLENNATDLVSRKYSLRVHPRYSSIISAFSYLVLATNIPDSEANVLVLHSFNIESCKIQR
jgi:hypothetical protein